MESGDADARGAETIVREYYDALDGHAYDDLESLLAPDFRQRRPDRRFEGRDAFVRFMREERPNRNTTHELEGVLGDGDGVAVRGRLLDGDSVLFEFADFFQIDGERIVRLDTYSR